MAAKLSKRPDLEVHLGSSGRISGRLHLGSGKRSAFSYDQRWLLGLRFFTLQPAGRYHFVQRCVARRRLRRASIVGRKRR